MKYKMADNIITRAKAVFTNVNYTFYLTCIVYEQIKHF